MKEKENVVDITELTEQFSKELHITKQKTSTILKEYINICRENLTKGIPVIIPNVCIIYDKEYQNELYFTNGFLVYEISQRLHYPYIMVESVINKMFRLIIQYVTIEQKPIILRNLFKLYSTVNENGSISLHIAKTTALKNTNVMVHTCKWMKQEVNSNAR